MKRAVIWVLLAVSVGVYADDYGDLLDVAVVRVYDGDTFFVDLPGLHPIIGDEIGIRVRGLDTPEIRGDCDAEKALAREARDYARGALESAARVDLTAVERGRYFRIVATVMVDGVDLADILINAELAVPYDGEGPRGSWCE